MFCLEEPSGDLSTASLGFAFSTTNNIDEGTSIGETTTYGMLVGTDFSNQYSAGETQTKTSFTLADFTNTTLTNKYIYIVGDDNQTAHTFTTGKFLIKLYGTNF